jgi:octaprenyl-diphosphate synthase
MGNVSATTLQKMDLQEILAPISQDMKSLDQVISARLASKVVLIDQISTYIIQAGGKRIRPALLFLVANALSNAANTAYRHELAAVVEFIHTATLLHDDVVDESDLRRGRKTANAVFGNAASVLVGDFLYSRAFQMMVEPGILRVMEILSSATNTIAEGEVLQLLNMHDPDVDEERYLQVILFKTAKLFEASTELGAILTGASPELIQAAANYGKHIGIAFQLVDDWLDYTANSAQMGKNAGDDLREGKPTLPLIYLLNHGTDHQKSLAKHAIERDEELTETFFNEVFSAVQSSGALDYTLEFAKREAEKARQCLATFPENEATRSLSALCDYSLARTT